MTALKLFVIVVLISCNIFGGLTIAKDNEIYTVLQIEKNGKMATIFPSFHGPNIQERQDQLDRMVLFVIKENDGGVCFENDPTEAALEFLDANSLYRSVYFDSKYRSSLYSADGGNDIVKLLNVLGLSDQIKESYIKLGTPIDLQQRVLLALLSNYPRTKRPSMDAVIKNAAKILKLSVEYLESVDYVSGLMLATLNDHDLWRSAVSRLAQFSNCRSCIDRYIQLFAESERLVLKGQVESARDLYAEAAKMTGEDILVLDALGSERNPGLAERIEERLAAGRCLTFAIGASHFGGSRSLRQELKKRGFDTRWRAIRDIADNAEAMVK